MLTSSAKAKARALQNRVAKDRERKVRRRQICARYYIKAKKFGRGKQRGPAYGDEPILNGLNGKDSGFGRTGLRILISIGRTHARAIGRTVKRPGIGRLLIENGYGLKC